MKLIDQLPRLKKLEKLVPIFSVSPKRQTRWILHESETGLLVLGLGEDYKEMPLVSVQLLLAIALFNAPKLHLSDSEIEQIFREAYRNFKWVLPKTIQNSEYEPLIEILQSDDPDAGINYLFGTEKALIDLYVNRIKGVFEDVRRLTVFRKPDWSPADCNLFQIYEGFMKAVCLDNNWAMREDGITHALPVLSETTPQA